MPSYSMSEDTRSSSAPRPRRVLVLSNPDPGDSSSSEDERPRYPPHHPQDSNSSLNQHPTSVIPTPPSRPPRRPAPPLTTTDLPNHYPPSRSNPNLSSPSSQSSNAVESTPPPSTPGQTAHSDLSHSVITIDDGTALVERTETAQPPTRLQKIADVLHFRHRRPSHRHLGSDVSLHSPSPSSSSPTVPPPPAWVIMVTYDCHAYTAVDITNANSAAFIWERIFAELKVPHEDQSGQLSIYRTQIGKVAIGDPLSDDNLIRLVRDRGDSEGSLKFLVCPSQARVQDPSLLSSPVKSVPPPPVPVFSPLVPRPRATKSSQQESVSSDDLTPDAGYEPSVISDDIDDSDNRSTMRPPPHPNLSATTLSSPPHSARYEDRQPSPASAKTPQSASVDRHRYDSPHGQSLPSSQSTPILENFLSKRHLRRGSDAETVEQAFRDLERAAELADAEWTKPQDKGIIRARAVKHRPERLTTSDDHAGLAAARDNELGSVVRKPSPPSSSGMARSPSTKRRPSHTEYPPRPSQTKKGGGGKPVPSHYISAHKPTDSSTAIRTVNKAKSSEFLKNPLPPMLRTSPSRPHLPTPSSSGTNSYPRPLDLGPRPRPLPQSRPDIVNVDTTTYTRAQQPSASGTLGYLSPTQEPYPRPHSASPSQQRYPTNDIHRDRDEFRPTHQAQSSSGSSRFGDVPLREDGYGITLPSSLRPGPYAGSPARTNPPSETPPRSPVTSRPGTSNTTCGLTFTSTGTMVPSTFKNDSGAGSQESTATESTLRPDEKDKLVWDIRASILSDSSDDGVGTNETYGTASSDLWSRKPTSENNDSSRTPIPGTKQNLNPSRPALHVTTPSSGPGNMTRGVPANFPAPPSFMPQLRPPRPRTPKTRHKSTTFEESTWAHRPPPEDVYDRLEEFFPEHDLDKPVIEANSGGTSPTAIDYNYGIPNIADRDKALVRPKKSIRIVAEEHKKRIDRFSRADPLGDNSIWRKRSTKLWGSRIEEVDTSSQTLANYSKTLPDSPAGGPRPIFKWVRGELIGKGTYGRVYLALNATTGEMIAVKQVEIPVTASDRKDNRQMSFVQALKMESETLKDLDHPHIVQYLGFEETPTFLSIFLEYVPGGSVGSCLRDHGKFDEEVTKSFTGQILEGLEYLHSKNIIHRDLKADNILVEKTGICKISDFGISKRTDDLNGMASTAMQGTVFWMAPEVIHPQKKGYNSKIDIWSVGCVVLEMWAGKRPWSDDEAITVMFKVYQNKQPPPIPSDVVLSELAKDFKDRCFAIDPDERASAADLQLHPYLELPEGWIFNDFK
ncbi:MAP kinase [Suillus discolor]|uniref:MAP kinase n=1 Tax=Suillus discolor TaxID=1912936 RepID=A0A9P7FN03_9AGAM|nr:MAP kinase [Suillus discolor]KAG2120796.1 MAP kinase [Suillus discolor]